MTQPQEQADETEVLYDVTLGNLTVQARQIDPNLYTSLMVRLQIADKERDDQRAFMAHVRALANIIGNLVPDGDQIDRILDLVASGEITAEEIVEKICLAGANREERRGSARKPGNSGTARREPVGRNRRGGRPR